MFGSFSKESLEKFQGMLSLSSSQDFSESVFDFTRCVRTDGTAYGTAGKCRKGTEEEKQNAPISKDRQMSMLTSMAKADLNGPEYEGFRKVIDKLGTAIYKVGKVIEKGGEEEPTYAAVQDKMGGLEEKLAKKAFDELFKAHAESKGIKNMPTPKLASSDPGSSIYDDGFRRPLHTPAYEAMVHLAEIKAYDNKPVDFKVRLKEIMQSEVYEWSSADI
jgi:hypothetical protein